MKNDPTRLPPPESMTAALAAKWQAHNQLEDLFDKLCLLRDKQRAWNKRLGVCLRAVAKFGAEKR